MALLQNGYRHNLIGNLFGGTNLDGANPAVHVYRGHRTAAQRNSLSGVGITDNLASVPNGNTHPSSWIMAWKAGGMSARVSDVAITGTADGLMGLPTSGSTTITFTVSDADGQLITSGSGSTSFSISTNTPLLTASINGVGSTSFAITTNTPVLGALADLIGECSFSLSSTASILPIEDDSPLRTGSVTFSISGELVPYAIGHMEGSTIDESVLTPNQIAATVWSSAASEFNDAGTMGNKLNTASSGGVDLNALAEAVWDYQSAEELTEMIEFLQKIVKNKREITSTKDLIVYDNDGITPILNKALSDKDGAAIADLATGVLAREAATSV